MILLTHFDCPLLPSYSRGCRANPHGAEKPGCQKVGYKGNWVDMCTCDEPLCNGAAPLGDRTKVAAALTLAVAALRAGSWV